MGKAPPKTPRLYCNPDSDDADESEPWCCRVRRGWIICTILVAVCWWTVYASVYTIRGLLR